MSEPDHDFGWALAKMRDGYKVTRPEMRTLPGLPVNDGWMAVEDGALVAHNGPLDRIRVEHLLAYDWELVDD